MPVVLKKKPPEPSPHGHVQSAGKQEDFFAAGVELAAKLGWSGDDPTMLGNDIAVEDARGFLIKSLHEAFIAGAKSETLTDPHAVCEHLGLEDDADLALVDAALRAALEAGNGVEVTNHPIVHGMVGANLVLPISKAAEDAAKAV
jgi:hypothetical protein